MGNNENNCFSLIVEGEIEREFITFLKAQIYQVKTMIICRRHSKTINGTISLKHIKNDCSDCCLKVHIFDKDEIEDKVFKEIVKQIHSYNLLSIVSNPCLEVVILCLFKEVNTMKSKKEIYEQLKQETKKYNLTFENKSKRNDLVKIYKWMENKVKKDKSFLSVWEKRLKTLNEKGISNFIDIIKLMKR